MNKNLLMKIFLAEEIKFLRASDFQVKEQVSKQTNPNQSQIQFHLLSMFPER